MRGVYAIQCDDGRAYVGSTRDIKQRGVEHRSRLRRGAHSNRPLQEAWDALGEQAFAFVELERLPVGDLLAAEQRWMDRFRAAGGLFNRAPKAGTCAGVVHGAEIRAKNSLVHRGRVISPAQRAKTAAALAGEKSSSAKLSEADVREIRRRRAGGETQRRIAASFSVAPSAVSLIIRRKTWNHLQ